MHPLAPAATAAALLMILVGCSTPGGDVTNPTTPGRPSFQTAGPLPSAGTPVDLTDAQLAGIRADLDGRGVTGQFRVNSATSVTWPDGSWGCPEPGQMYTQALVAGVHALVTAEGTSYDYRFGTGPTPRLCKP